eukprot:2938898-Pleurochrysis_carterae.AAC.2
MHGDIGAEEAAERAAVGPVAPPHSVPHSVLQAVAATGAAVMSCMRSSIFVCGLSLTGASTEKSSNRSEQPLFWSGSGGSFWSISTPSRRSAKCVLSSEASSELSSTSKSSSANEGRSTDALSRELLVSTNSSGSQIPSSPFDAPAAVGFGTKPVPVRGSSGGDKHKQLSTHESADVTRSKSRSMAPQKHIIANVKIITCNGVALSIAASCLRASDVGKRFVV